MPKKQSDYELFLKREIDSKLEKYIRILVDHKIKKLNINATVLNISNRNYQNSFNKMTNQFLNFDRALEPKNFNSSKTQILTSLSSELQRIIFRNL